MQGFDHCRRFTGLEYALVHAQPPLFVIQRRDRLSPTEGFPSSLHVSPDAILMFSSPPHRRLFYTQ